MKGFAHSPRAGFMTLSQEPIIVCLILASLVPPSLSLRNPFWQQGQKRLAFNVRLPSPLSELCLFNCCKMYVT